MGLAHARLYTCACAACELTAALLESPTLWGASLTPLHRSLAVPRPFSRPSPSGCP